MSSLLTLDSSADSEAVGYCHLGEGTLGSHIVSRGPAAGNMGGVILLHLSHRRLNIDLSIS